MNYVRTTVEWELQEVIKFFPLIDFKRKLKVKQDPVG